MMQAGVAIIDKQGRKNVELLLPILENYLDKKVKFPQHLPIRTNVSHSLSYRNVCLAFIFYCV